MEKNVDNSFSSRETLIYLLDKIDFLFHTQQYISSALQEAFTNSRMIAILGREGMGKSSAVAHFLFDNPMAYYVRIGQSYRIKNFIDEMIFQVSGAYPVSHDNIFTKVKMLSRLLTKDNSKKLFVIDDSGKLKNTGLGICQELRDNTIGRVGFVYIGLPYFQKNLLRARNLGVVGIGEFYRRIESWYTIPGLKRSEISDYGVARKLSSHDLQRLTDTGVQTISELEHLVNKLIEERELENYGREKQRKQRRTKTQEIIDLEDENKEAQKIKIEEVALS